MQVANNQVGAASETWARTDYSYNSRNRLEYVSVYNGAALDNVTKYTYDGVGNTLTMTAGLSAKTATDGKTTTYTYDRLGRMLTMKDALNQTESYAYKNNGLGLLNSKTDRNGNSTQYSYDNLGRPLTVIATTPANETDSNHFTYALTGLTKSMESKRNGIRVAATTYEYDTLGRLKKETEGNGPVKQYTYDIADNRKTFTASVGGSTSHNLSYDYDSLNRLYKVYENGTVQATYAYNTNGARQSLTYANGTSEVYTYNLANWLTNLQNKKSSTVLSSYAYTYYADGNQRSKTDHNGRLTNYAYDSLGRLTGEQENSGFAASYAYDRFGNRASMAVTGTENYSMAYTYDANNRLTQDTKVAGNVTTNQYYQYDPNGNQIAKWQEVLAPAGSALPQVGINSPGGEIYRYDGFNRLSYANVGWPPVEYTYRADGLRQSQFTSTGTIVHLWDGQNIVADMQNNTVTNRYIRGANLLYAYEGATKQFYLYNGHGDVVQLTGTTGAVSRAYDYDAFGNQRELAGYAPANDANPFRYCGEYYDSSSGTYYLRNRHYNPVNGRFTQEDTVRARRMNLFDPYGDYQDTVLSGGMFVDEEEGQYIVDDPLSLNLYTYTHNNPVMYQDPSGHNPLLAAVISTLAKVTTKQLVVLGLGSLSAAGIANLTEAQLNDLGIALDTLAQKLVDLGSHSYGAKDSIMEVRRENIDPYAREGQKKQQRELKEKKKKKDWDDRSNKHQKPPKKHTPAKPHQKYPQNK